MSSSANVTFEKDLSNVKQNLNKGWAKKFCGRKTHLLSSACEFYTGFVFVFFLEDQADLAKDLSSSAKEGSLTFPAQKIRQ